MKTLCCFILFILSTFVCSQNLISIDAPKPNDTIKSKELLVIKYSIIGSQTCKFIHLSCCEYTNNDYASFSWTEHTNQSNSYSFNVASGLKTNAYPGGTRTVQHQESWRVPGCHFFSRYPPTSFDFSLKFTPLYAESNAIGTPQDTITIPLSITVDNSTFPKC
ncbi:hypothetical protein BD560DRAFT_398886 [Blakeslea trispora]|nr:hypothetical protein BD560DRAFT_398886 [Blakeslea trispora]